MRRSQFQLLFSELVTLNILLWPSVCLLLVIMCCFCRRSTGRDIHESFRLSRIARLSFKNKLTFIAVLRQKSPWHLFSYCCIGFQATLCHPVYDYVSVIEQTPCECRICTLLFDWGSDINGWGVYDETLYSHAITQYFGRRHPAHSWFVSKFSVSWQSQEKHAVGVISHNLQHKCHSLHHVKLCSVINVIFCLGTWNIWDHGFVVLSMPSTNCTLLARFWRILLRYFYVIWSYKYLCFKLVGFT